MEVNNDLSLLRLTSFKLEDGLSYLLLSKSGWIQVKLLGHLPDNLGLANVCIINCEGIVLLVVLLLSIGHTSVDEIVFSSLVPLVGLFLDLLLSVDESILVSVMVVIDDSVLVIHLDHLLPVVCLFRLLVVLDSLELVRESSSHHQLVSSEFIVASYFLCDQSLEVLVDAYSLHQAVNLFAVREELTLDLLVENRLLTLWAEFMILVFINKQLWTPWWWHVKDFFFKSLVVLSILIVIIIDVVFVLILFLLVLLDHDILPVSRCVIFEVHVHH